MGGLHLIYMIGRRYGNGIHDSRMAWMGRWIHITGWENGPLFDLSTLSILSVLEIENVQATAAITIGTVSLNSNYFLSTNTFRIASQVTLTNLSKHVPLKVLEILNIIFSMLLML